MNDHPQIAEVLLLFFFLPFAIDPTDFITELLTSLLEVSINTRCKFSYILLHMSMDMSSNEFSTVWNNAWLIDIKDKYFKQFFKEVEKYLCKYKGQEILEKNSKTKEEGGLGLIWI